MATPEPLTPEQREALELIEGYELDHGGVTPSVRWLARELGRTVGAAQARLNQLEAKGWIERTGKRRGIAILHRLQRREAGGATRPVLLAGTIAAGGPIEALEERQEWINVPAEWVGDRPCYILRVEGHSMADLIHDKDLVLVWRGAPFVAGGVYVCIHPETNEATLKAVYKERGGYRLQPLNPDYEPTFVKKLELRGQVIATVRKLGVIASRSS